MMKSIKNIICIFLVLLLTVSVAGCTGDKPTDDTVETPDTLEDTDNIIEGAPDQSDVMFWGEDENISFINTPHIDLEYPTSWDSMFTIEDYEEGDSYILKFMGRDDMTDMCIFYVRFGGSDEQATHLGWLDEVPIYVYVNDDTSYLGDDQLEKFYELQGCVNDIIVQIQYDESFIR